MRLDELRDHCLGQPGAAEDQPFGDDLLAFKVGGKIFALLNLADLPARVNLKCDPERAVQLRERHAAIVPGYHMNKRHWNTVYLDGRLSGGDVRALVDHSYALVLASLPKRVRTELEHHAK